MRLYAAYTTGHVRVHDLVSCTLSLSIAAHARTINALEVHPYRETFVTVSEDTTLGVWSLAEPAPKLSHMQHVPVTDWLLTGVAFCGGADGTHVAVTAYDAAALQAWRLD